MRDKYRELARTGDIKDHRAHKPFIPKRRNMFERERRDKILSGMDAEDYE